MDNWFHHDPATGRNGPFSTGQLLERYRQRLLQADTLVWREGLREWQPLERAMAALDTVLGPQDSSMPPPLPAYASAPAMVASASDRFHPRTRTRSHQKQGMSGCLIALIVVAVLAVPMMAILAAIALPAYRDYTIKAKTVQAISQSRPLQNAVIDYFGSNGTCPSAGDPGFENMRRFTSPVVESVELGIDQNGVCAFVLSLHDAQHSGKSATAVMTMVAREDAYTFEFNCQASTLAEIQPSACRDFSEDPR